MRPPCQFILRSSPAEFQHRQWFCVWFSLFLLNPEGQHPPEVQRCWHRGGSQESCHRSDLTQLYSGISLTSCPGFFLYQFYYNPQIGIIISYSKSLFSEAVDAKQLDSCRGWNFTHNFQLDNTIKEQRIAHDAHKCYNYILKSHPRFLVIHKILIGSTHIVAQSPWLGSLHMVSLLLFVPKSWPIAGAWDFFASCHVHGVGSGPLIRTIIVSSPGDKIVFEKYSVIHSGQEGEIQWRFNK